MATDVNLLIGRDGADIQTLVFAAYLSGARDALFKIDTLTSLKELFIEVRLPSDEKASHAFVYLPDTWTREGRRAVNGSDVMRTLALGLLSVLLLLAVLLSLLLPATATAQDKEDLKAVRADNSVLFYMGYITGLTNGYIAANLVTCPRPVNGVMVLGVLDSRDRPYDDRTPEAAVLHALVDLGCPADSAASTDIRSETTGDETTK